METSAQTDDRAAAPLPEPLDFGLEERFLNQVWVEHSRVMGLRADIEKFRLLQMACDAPFADFGEAAEAVRRAVGGKLADFVAALGRYDEYRKSALDVISSIKCRQSRRMLVERYLFFRDYEEAAGELGIKTRSAYKVHYRALSEFRAALLGLMEAEAEDGAEEGATAEEGGTDGAGGEGGDEGEGAGHA